MSLKARSEDELELMRKSGQISAQTLKKLIENVKVGTNLMDLEKMATEEIQKLGGSSSFKTVPGYKWTTCLCLNSEVVHAIPRDYSLQEGDLLSIDLGSVYQGWHSDTAWSVIVGRSPSPFLAAGEEAMWKGTSQAVDGKKIGDISAAMQSIIEGKGYSVVRSLVGHGIGRALHEKPEVPGYGKPNTGLELKDGMTLAIEILYTEGSGQVRQASDGWTIVSADGTLGGMFEMTVVVGLEKPEILTDWRKV